MGLDIYLYEAKKSEQKKVGYFRKDNAFLHWVDTHVKEVENCVDITISKEQLKALQNTLLTLTKENCAENFPTQNGFFYGSTDYDEWYWDGVEELKQWVKETLQTFNFEENNLIFHAWW